jgi:hypothetical protein
MSEDATPIQAVNDYARNALASLWGRLRPFAAGLRRGPRVAGISPGTGTGKGEGGIALFLLGYQVVG